MSDLPTHVDIHEEGPREGFQIELGADVIKVEPAPQGDHTRGLGGG
jgi:hypothetical protein